MCEALTGIRAAMGRFASGFEPALVAATDAAAVVDHASTIEKMAATVKALAAARVAETEVWRRDGDRSAAHHLARTTGTTVGAAADVIRAARRLDGLGKVGAVARQGELSSAQVAAIADAATADPSAEARLVDQARSSSLQELKDDCARTRAAASADAEGRRRRIHERRCLRTYTHLEWLYPACAVRGCSAVARLEMDYRDDWAATHITLFSLIDRLCPHHHRMKTRKNWGLVDGRGKRAFVPPTDARHPQHASRRQRRPAAAATGPPGPA